MHVPTLEAAALSVFMVWLQALLKSQQHRGN